ncbi:YwmB family TATA-box binding protein [Peribacillus sp. JNUCC 23]
MKKTLTYIVFLGFILIFLGNSTSVAKNKSDIEKIIEQLEANINIEIGDWSVYAREKTLMIETRKDFNKEVKKLQRIFPDFTWTITAEEEKWTATATYVDPQTNLTESLHLMSTQEKSDIVSYLIYEAKGHSWNADYSSFIEGDFQDRKKVIFRGKPATFTCVKGTFNDNIDTVLTSESIKLLGLFQAEEMESIKEPHFISVSAKSNMFTETLTHESMNLQLALRTDGLGEKTTFVVGTPIITFEY